MASLAQCLEEFDKEEVVDYMNMDESEPEPEMPEIKEMVIPPNPFGTFVNVNLDHSFRTSFHCILQNKEDDSSFSF